MLFSQLDNMNMMASTQIVVYLTFFFLGVTAQTNNQKSSSSVHQEERLVSANTGDNVTLHCFCEGDEKASFYWYKQTFGEKPRLVSTLNKDKNSIWRFHDEFKSNPHFTLDFKNGKNDLKISDLRISDSATYYCMRSNSTALQFLERITLSVNDSGLSFQVLVQQSPSDTIQSGGSVTLNCTVHTGTCDGEHSVYWFKDSQESAARLIYTHGGRNDQCERKPNTQTHTCVYNLPMNNLNVSHAGTYYCAVASCGHILFGNGTKLDFEGFTDEQYSPVFVYFLVAALIITTIISVLLSFFLYKMNKSNSCQSTELKAQDSAVSGTQQDEDNLHYAALKKNMKGQRRQRSNTNSECVYSGIKL